MVKLGEGFPLGQVKEEEEVYDGWLQTSIHPFSITAKSIRQVVGGLEPIPAVIGQEVGYRLPVHHRATQRDK